MKHSVHSITTFFIKNSFFFFYDNNEVPTLIIKSLYYTNKDNFVRNETSSFTIASITKTAY